MDRILYRLILGVIRNNEIKVCLFLRLSFSDKFSQSYKLFVSLQIRMLDINFVNRTMSIINIHVIIIRSYEFD